MPPLEHFKLISNTFFFPLQTAISISSPLSNFSKKNPVNVLPIFYLAYTKVTILSTYFVAIYYHYSKGHCLYLRTICQLIARTGCGSVTLICYSILYVLQVMGTKFQLKPGYLAMELVIALVCIIFVPK